MHVAVNEALGVELIEKNSYDLHTVYDLVSTQILSEGSKLTPGLDNSEIICHLMGEPEEQDRSILWGLCNAFQLKDHQYVSNVLKLNRSSPGDAIASFKSRLKLLASGPTRIINKLFDKNT